MWCYIFLFLHVCRGDWSPDRPMDECDDYWIWGPQDERGTNNYQTAEKALEAMQLMKEGKVYDLTHTLDADMAIYPGRSYQLLIPDSPIGRGGSNMLGWNDEFLASTIGQVGTQYDSLAHVMTLAEDINGTETQIYYNGYNKEEVVSPYGMKKLGIEKLQPFFTRGIMLDFARHRGVEYLGQGEAIRLNEFFDVLREQGLRRADITEGSYVLLHTGQYKVRASDADAYMTSWPGADLETLEWLAKKGVSVVGSDAFSLDVHPNPEYPESFAADHQLLIVCAGMGMLEQVNSQALAEDQVYEFAWIYAPVKLRGATGSPGAGIAVV